MRMSLRHRPAVPPTSPPRPPWVYVLTTMGDTAIGPWLSGPEARLTGRLLRTFESAPRKALRRLDVLALAAGDESVLPGATAMGGGGAGLLGVATGGVTTGGGGAGPRGTGGGGGGGAGRPSGS